MSTATSTCPICGGIECLCRPRFFAGQLLTDEDLNRLDAYVRGKQRLHNRSLHGFGVVNGLDVRCDPCDHRGVVVTPGHALAPCGEDIVVCEPSAVDICELVRACEPPGPDPCLEPRRADDDCEDIQEWALAICYREYSTRGVVPLRPTGPSCGCGSPGGCGCGGCCGGSGGCGCGGSGGQSASTSHAHAGHAQGGGAHAGPTNGNGNGHGYPGLGARSRAALECEPTVVCESYYFGVKRVPRGRRYTDPQSTDVGGRWGSSGPASGAVAERFEHCIAGLRERVPPALEDDANREEQHEWCCATRAGILEHMRHGPVYDCSLSARVAQIHCPPPPESDDDEAGFDAAMTSARDELDHAIRVLVEACLCWALQPPAPEPVAENCVVLATVRVRMSDCRVLSVCNWTPQRKYVLSAPAIEHWASQIPLLDAMRDSIYRRCCGERAPKYPEPQRKYAAVEAFAMLARSADEAPPPEVRARMVLDESLDENAELNPVAFMLASELGDPLRAIGGSYTGRKRPKKPNR